MADDGVAISWNVDLEVSLFHAMRRHKPVGVNRHFQMACIVEKLNAAVSRKISAQQVWQHLASMYDLSALNESEISPFPSKENEFLLPSYEYSTLMNQNFPRCPEAIPPVDDGEPGREKEGGGKTTRQKTAQTVAHTTKTAQTVAHTAAQQLLTQPGQEESPKREQRKRTRGQLGTPASAENTPTGKRARRT